MTEILDTIREHSGPLTVDREDTETVTRGYAVSSSSPVVGVEGHMQPLSPKEMRYVPEGLNTLERHHIWSLQEIKEGDLVTNGSAPTVRVDNVEYWKEAPFWHAQGGKVEDALTRTTVFPVFAAAFANAFV